MRLEYESKEIREQTIEISESYHELYKLYMLELTKLKSFDYKDLKLFIEEELASGKNTKKIKYLPDEKAYEFRIPPHRKNGVLRMLFVVEDDYWTICIKKVWTKGTKPSPQKRRENERKKRERNSNRSS